MTPGRWGVLGVVLALVGCASSAPRETGSAPGLSVRDGSTLEGPPCSAESPDCPEGTLCAVVELATGPRSLCVEGPALCQRLQCASGECVVLESFPAQVRCR